MSHSVNQIKGIHPPTHKTSHQTLLSSFVPNQLILPLAQFRGDYLEPVPNVGARVLKGEVIAKPQTESGTYLHAPTSGKLVSITEHTLTHASGLKAPCIFIEPDSKDEWIEPRDYSFSCDKTLFNALQHAGIVGLGGAGFPTHLKTRSSHTLKTLLINGAECEPYISADDALMQHYPTKILDGAEHLIEALKPQQTIIAIEDNKPAAIKALSQAVRGTPIQIVAVPTIYPTGGEKQLIEIITGQQVPHQSLPISLGILCLNIGTVAAVSEARTNHQPVISRITTVTGGAVKQAGNRHVLIGTPIDELLAHHQFDTTHTEKVLHGGPLMGFELKHLDTPILKTSNCIIAAATEELVSQQEAPCIRCGFCAEACPANLLPQQLYWYSRSDDIDMAEKYHLSSCIECGACAYVCPSHIPLVQYFQTAKFQLQIKQQDKQQSDIARHRHENRQLRLERIQAERAAKRTKLKPQTQEKNSQLQSSVQAAIERAKQKRKSFNIPQNKGSSK